MKYDVIAYCWNDALAGFTREDAQRLTHVNLAFGLLKDGLLDLHLLKYLHLLPKLREWNPEMKIVLSVGGWGADGFSDMAMTEEGRRNFAKSCLDAVEKYNLDGIDIDWEYPCNDAAGIGADPRDKENFTALLATLREYLGKDRIVSIRGRKPAVHCGYPDGQGRRDRGLRAADDLRHGGWHPRRTSCGSRRDQGRQVRPEHPGHCGSLPPGGRSLRKDHHWRGLLRAALCGHVL